MDVGQGILTVYPKTPKDVSLRFIDNIAGYPDNVTVNEGMGKTVYTVNNTLKRKKQPHDTDKTQ